MLSSRRSSQPRDRTQVSYIYLYWQAGSLPLSATWEAHLVLKYLKSNYLYLANEDVNNRHKYNIPFFITKIQLVYINFISIFPSLFQWMIIFRLSSHLYPPQPPSNCQASFFPRLRKCSKFLMLFVIKQP